MDPLSALFDGPRARSAFALRMVMEPPWALRIADRAPLAMVAVVAGQVWVTPEQGEPMLLDEGAVGLVRGPETYRLGDRPDPEPEMVVHPGQRCEDLDGRPLAEPLSQGVRTWGNAVDGSTNVLVGVYEALNEAGRRAVEHLPTVAAVRGAEVATPLLEMMGVELTRSTPGQTMVLDRLLDLLTVATVRSWFAQHAEHRPSWWQATDDPVVGPAMRLLHHNLSHPWTVAELAREVGVSRATLARRFTELTGQSPMALLAEARLGTAADLLSQPGARVSAVAEAVGYTNPFAFSTAFKRWAGVSPSRYRPDELRAVAQAP